jgi:hypothetical protein
MAGIFQGNPLNPGDSLEPRFDTNIGNFIISAIQNQSIHVNFVGSLPSFPMFQSTGNDELRRSLPFSFCLLKTLAIFSDQTGVRTWSHKRLNRREGY